jgi:hypothetical protein
MEPEGSLPVPTVCQMNTVHIPPHCFFNIIITSFHLHPMSSLLQVSWPKSFMYFPLSHACYIQPIHPIFLDLIIIMCVQSTDYEAPHPAYYYVFSLRFKYSPLYSFLSIMWDMKFHTATKQQTESWFCVS